MSTHGAMFVPVIISSDKTTVLVATGHQEFHPVYMSPGNLTNTAQCAHGNALLPVAFLPIPKSKYLVISHWSLFNKFGYISSR
jgi:Plavaka transposase